MSDLEIEDTRTFALSLVERLLTHVEQMKAGERQSEYDQFVAEELAPFEPLLKVLQVAIKHPGWPHSEIALGKFLLIVDYFQQVTEDKRSADLGL